MKAIEKQIAARLLSAGELTEKNLEKALKRHTGRQGFADLLLDKGYASKRAIARALAEVNGFDFVDMDKVRPAPEALAALKREEALQLRVLPVEYDENRLVVVLADSNDVYTPDHLRARLGCEITIRITEKDDLSQALDRYYAESSEDFASGEDEESSNPSSHREYQRRVREMRSSGMVPKNISQMETVVESSVDEISTLEGKGEQDSGVRSDSMPTADFGTAQEHDTESELERILRKAIEAKAHDIEFTPLEHCVGVRSRSGAHWLPVGMYPINQHDQIVACLLEAAGLQGSWKDVRPDREMTLKTPFGEMVCRLLFQESADGLRAVIRFPENMPLIRNPLLRLGLPTDLTDQINKRIRAHSGGLLFISSGNARTLDHVYSSIIAGFGQVGGKDVVSLEHFQRRRIPGVTPIHCPSEDALLMDLENAEFMTPDVIGIQMITGSKILKRAFEVSLGGTSVIACMTSPDVETAQSCLSASNIEPMNLYRGMIGHLHVEVAKKLCTNCARVIEDTDSLPDWAGVMESEFREATGCEKCDGTGYSDEAYLVDFYHPDPQDPKAGLVNVLDRQTGLIALSVAGEIDPREYS